MKNIIEQTDHKTLSLSKGFSAVELLITLFVASAFLISGYQLYGVVIKDGGDARKQSIASNAAADYLLQYKTSAYIQNPCSVATAYTGSPAITGLTAVTVTVSVTCPYNSSPTPVPSISRLTASVTYGSPAQTVTVGTYVK